MPTYTVKDRQKAEVWTGQFGPMQAWDLLLVKEGVAFPCQANTQIKDGVVNEFPAIGEQVEGDISTKNGREIFKRARPANAGSSSGGGSFQRDPKERESIVRQHSQHMAIMWAVVHQKKAPDINPSFDWLKQLIDWFDRDAKGEPQS